MLARLAIFADHIPDEWITAAAALSEKATIRRRRLPSDMVLWLVVGMAFFRNEPISEVARRLNICAEGLANDALLADSALSPGPSATRQTAARVAVQTVRRCVGAGTLS